MSGYNYSVAYNGDCATLFAHVKGRHIPLISSTEKLQVECIYHNILTGMYRNARELCEDINRNFSVQATLLVRVTLYSTEHLAAKA